MLKLKPEVWTTLAVIALTVSVAIEHLTRGGAALDFLAGLFLGLAFALSVGALVLQTRAR